MRRGAISGILLGLIFVGLMPPFTASAVNSEGVGFLFIDVPEGVWITVDGVGSYEGPVALELSPGRYTVEVREGVEIVADVFVTQNNVTVLHIDPKTIETAVLGKGVVSVRAVFNESANYSREKLNPPFNPFFFPGGCGGGFPYINISKPYPMSLLVRGREEIYLILNGTFMHLGDDDGKACVSYVGVYPGMGEHLETVWNATYLVPWARLEISSEPEDLTVYINGGYSRYVLYTPIGLYVPAIPHDVYNATARGFYRVIQIPVIHRLETHRVGVADGNYLVESIVKVSPSGNYSVNVNMDRVKLALRMERRSAEESAVLKYLAKSAPAEKSTELKTGFAAPRDLSLEDAVAVAPTKLFHRIKSAL
ncbi:hypothetical protein E3E38_02700 [Thermococcus sp. 18S1]|uniref:hypothetical protein n=1 Tax=Thermococcus sp. 18S1 TaxID=1638210 RepID=UPI00143BE995|nr:hypothetical protein [Thermococcus sp. 18S1]NJE29960.1 hypothetical protein [Thermococcus sp. 18S1]